MRAQLLLLVLLGAQLIVGQRTPDPVETTPGDLIIAERDGDLDGGGASLWLHMPLASGLSAPLYNASLGGDVFRVVFDAVELVERRAMLVYGARTQKSGCTLEIREYSTTDGRLRRTVYSAHDPSPDRRHCQAEYYRASPAQPAQGTRHQWMCTVETSNRLLVFNPATYNLVELRLNSGDPAGSPIGKLGDYRLDTLDLSLHCSSLAAAESNNRRAYVALRTQDAVLALDETLALVGTGRVERPRWLQLGAHWLYVLGTAPVPELLRLDPTSLAAQGGSTLLPADVAGAGVVGSAYVDEQRQTLMLLSPETGALQTIALEPALGATESSSQQAGMLTSAGSLVAAPGGQWLVPADGWRSGLDTDENDLAQHCNAQPQHATVIIPAVGLDCAGDGGTPVPLLVIKDTHTYAVYHAGGAYLGLHTSHPDPGNARWLDAQHDVGTCGGDTGDLIAGSLRVLAVDAAGALVVANVSLDPSDTNKPATVLVEAPQEDVSTVIDAAWAAPAYEYCYATRWALVCASPDGGNHTAWTVASPVRSLAVSGTRLIAFLADGHVVVRNLATLDPAQTFTLPAGTVAQNTSGLHYSVSRELSVFSSCSGRYRVPTGADSACSPSSTLTVSDDFTSARRPGDANWRTYDLQTSTSGTRISTPVFAVLAVSSAWSNARHLADGIKERSSGVGSGDTSATTIAFTAIVICLLLTTAAVAPIWCGHRVYKQRRQDKERWESGSTAGGTSVLARLLERIGRVLGSRSSYAATSETNSPDGPQLDIDEIELQEQDFQKEDDAAADPPPPPPLLASSSSAPDRTASPITGSAQQQAFDNVSVF